MSSAPKSTETEACTQVTPAQIDASCRLPLLVIFGSSAAWLVISAILGMIASLKFHNAGILGDCPFFTYGHVQAAAFNTLLYGFIAQAAIGVMLWLIARLGGTPLVQGGFAAIGASFWNIGVTLGLIGVMIGDGSGYEWFEFPKYAAPVLLAGYVLMGVVGGFTFAERKTTELYPSQWFLLAALFWFPWIYVTAVALIHWFPAVGVMQAVVHQWYAHNLLVVWLGSIGIAAVFYFLPALSNKSLASRNYALATFWLLIIFGGLGGMHPGMPVPAWLPMLSSVGSFLLLAPLFAFALNVHWTLENDYSSVPASVTLKFILTGAAALVAGTVINAFGAVPQVSEILHFTLFTMALDKLMLVGFAGMILVGCIDYILPKVTGVEWPFGKLIKLQFWLAFGAVVLLVFPLAIGGAIQGYALTSDVSFLDISTKSLTFLRISTVGEALWLLGSLFLFINVKLLGYRLIKPLVLGCVNDSKKGKAREATV